MGRRRRRTMSSVTTSGSNELKLSAYCGVDLQVTSPCRCGCASWRVHPHSSRSDLPVWKCSWCRVRKGKLTEIEIKTIKNFVRLFGWPILPIIFCSDGFVYAYDELPALRKTTTRVRWTDGNVSTLRECNASVGGSRLPDKGGSAVAERRGDTAKRASG
jgi:hypothetical protein